MGVQQTLDLGKGYRASVAVLGRYREHLEFHGGRERQCVWRECARQPRSAERAGEICRAGALERPRYAGSGEWSIDTGRGEIAFYLMVYAGRAADGRQ